MSRRSVTTIVASVKLRVPPGSSAAAVVEHITRVLRERKSLEIPHKGEGGAIYSTIDTSMSALDTDSMIVKLEKKETVYP